MPQFRKKYGEQLPDGTYQVTAPWQAGLSNGAVVGEIVCLCDLLLCCADYLSRSV